MTGHDTVYQVGEDGRSRWIVEPWRQRLGGNGQARWRLVPGGKS